MLKIGIRAHDLDTTNIDDLIQKLKSEKISNIQFVLSKAIKGDNGLYDEDKVKFYQEKFTKNNINIAMLGAYFNPVHSNELKVNEGIVKFKNHLSVAKALNTKYVGSETGSFNDDKWTYHPRNLSEEAYQNVLTIFSELVDYAKSQNCYVVIEGAYGHVINCPKRLKRLVDELASDNVKVIIDLFNYLSIDNHEEKYEIFDEALELLEDKIVIFHLKDYLIQDNKLITVGLGKGLIDFSLIINKIMKKCPNAYVIFEGVKNKDIATSKKMIEELIKNEEVAK